MRKLATIRQIKEVLDIPGADNICLAHIDGWQCVAKKGEFQKEDLCVYFEIDSILPDKPCFDFMRPRKFRVKTIKCMKQLSQGLALPLTIFSDFNLSPSDYQSVGEDVTDLLGVKKHDPEAQVESFVREKKKQAWYIKLLARVPFFRKWLFKKEHATQFPTDIVSKTDEERYQNATLLMKDCFVNVPFDVTEKIDGTSTTFIYRPKKRFKFWSKEFFVVCSRNFTKHIEDDSWWWRVARELQIRQVMTQLHSAMGLSADTYLIFQGETIGPDIQKNKYKVQKYDFFLFNLKTVTGNETTELAPIELKELLKKHNLAIKTVPILVSGKTVESVTELDEYFQKMPFGTKSVLNSKSVAEGIVVRLQNQNVSQFKSFKYIHPTFLLKYEE